MPAPKRPDPKHPLAQSAEEIEAEIAAALKTDEPKDPPADTPPADPAAKVVTDPPSPPQPPAPPAPAPAPADDRTQQMMDTMMGRIESMNDEIRGLTDGHRTLQENNSFLATRNTELARENAELKARIEAGAITQGFQSDLVDREHFSEINRGLNPRFKGIEDQLTQILGRLNKTDERVAAAEAAPAAAIGKFRKELLDKSVRRGTPEFAKLLKTDKVFQEFLQERIPGSRTTRMDQVQDAWKEDDDEYFNTVVSDYKRRGAPQPVPPADPPRAITEQQPKPPVDTPDITQDHMQAAFAQVLEGKMTRADYRKLDNAFKAQGSPAR